MTYSYTENRAYWASVIKSDMAKGRGAQRACADVFQCHLMTGGYTLQEAMVETQASALFAGVKPESVKW